MRVIVCGSREWTDREIVDTVLDGYEAQCFDDDEAELVVIEGGAKGADAAAADWSRRLHHNHLQFPADWDTHGKAAGPIRNQRMLDEGKPDVVVAFKDGFQHDFQMPKEDGSGEWETVKMRGGTEDLVRRAKAAGIPVYVISHG